MLSVICKKKILISSLDQSCLNQQQLQYFHQGTLLQPPLPLTLLLTMLLIILSAAAIVTFVIFAHPVSSLDQYCLNQTCGNITDIRYPFSLTSEPNCPSFSPFFKLECNISSGKLRIPFNNITLQVLEIHAASLIVDIGIKAVLSTNQSTQLCEDALGYSYTIQLAPFPGPYFIADDNNFGSFGCTTGVLYTANLEASSDLRNSSSFSDFEIGGCSVLFPDDKDNAECGYQSCCTVSTIASSRYAYYYARASTYHNRPTCNSPCSSNYATLFHPNYTDFDNESYRLKLKWALPSTLTANEIIQSSDYACSKTANFTIVHEVPGYRCSCSPGYTGDGYSNGSGCSDFDECKDPSKNDCIPRSTCHNLEGSYTCKCNSWFYVGDGHTNGSGCRFSPRIRNAFIITGAILVSALSIGSIVFLVKRWRKRKKRKYFMLNGGLQLQAYIARRGRETTRLFIAEELKAATKNYSNEMRLGVGGFGTVFKGVLEDGRVVAIKKANEGSDVDNDQFLNEMAIVMQINHKHIVRLLGCCLELPTPELVYEYVSNGNVAKNLEWTSSNVMGWEGRLKVARQTAEALAYLHAAAWPPILHRDVKSENVLLDDNLDAKVADFGISRLVPDGVEHPVSTAVQGTLGYLDPEYFQTLQLTDKSDVYSLGVMLVELVTGLKPVDNHSREPRFANLALLFISYMQQGRVDELIDPRLGIPPTTSSTSSAAWHTRHSIMALATLARRCLSLVGAERPSMSLVADELRQITQSLQHDIDDDESLALLSSTQMYVNYEAVPQNAQSYLQSSSHSMSIDNLLLNAPTMPR